MLGFKRGLPLMVGAVGVTLAALVAPAYASGTAQLKAFAAQVKTARGEFEQKQVKGQQDGAVKVTNNASGTFEFARPGRFVWHYTKPYDQLLQADGETLYVYDKDLNQVTERKLGASLGASPAAILFGSNDIEKSFTLKDAGVKNGIDWVELKPKAQDTQFQRVGIGFRDGNLAAMELYDAFGNVTLLTFSNMQKNPPLPADNFKFTVPKGADVIKG
ncbi:outer membrane lipoprotein chaperone LolA [Pandoraea sp. NPDC087047]|uniref:outer membrane lipoprotein chaperone LolA n=1 Tax=Pandoraea sp. NPDC087047 TaxID=3364390 RepID=UPI00382CB9BE